MSVQLNPNEILTFRRPLTRTSKEVLTINNPTDQDVAFKVKTTAPKLYCVRPNSGLVPAGEALEVQVMLQPFKEEPPMDQKCKDKFLVQTVALVGELKSLPVSDIWPHVEANAKNLIQQVKLRCSYVNGDGQEISSTINHSVSDSTLASTKETEIDTKETDELTKLRLELDAYKNELEALRSRAPDTLVESSVSKQNGIPLPVVVLVALVAIFLSYLVFRQ
ncbi:PapD-like protein [Halteromyces radiatus]|uniref:PapD-like protein n=1 Tax=Halteromyces radiatus TaxID=101107 RepID=UPI00221FEAD8|nr:PapD-like protein [Halteromyces radiatus]KAI8086454.1 PapD-like protein [Halteromyces radiatus]